MTLGINWLAVAAATLVGMVIAVVWYSDWGLAGAVWRKSTGVTKVDSARAGKAPMVVLVVSLILTAIGLAIGGSLAADFYDSESPWITAAVGGVAWLGFSLSTLAQHNGFELKPARLTVINSAYQLILFVGMGAVIGLVQQA